MGKTIDFQSGLVSGRLTTVVKGGIYKGYQMWLCSCSCGNTAVVRAAEFKAKKRTSCGCLRATVKDLTGRTFGSWVVIGPREVKTTKNGAKKSFWLCRCKCGFEKSICAGLLLVGATSKCSNCRNADAPRNPAGITNRNIVLSSYKIQARIRGLVWDISEDTFDELVRQSCVYCGEGPNNLCNQSKYGDFIYSGIDRIDNSHGYEPGNVVPCCKICNRAKDVMTQEQFLSWAKRVAEYSSTNFGGTGCPVR